MLPPLASENAALSFSAKAVVVLFPCFVIAFLYMGSVASVALSPLVFLPTLCMYWVWVCANIAHPERRGKLEHMVWIYLVVSIGGTTILGVAQLLAYLVLVSVIMGDSAPEYWTEFLRGTVEGMSVEERSRRAELAGTWQNWLLIILFSFIMAGGFEEVLKYLPVTYAKHLDQKLEKRRDRTYLDFAVAGSLGIATVECIGFLHDTYASGSHEWLAPFVTLAQRLIAGSMGHILVAVLTSFRAIRSDFHGPKRSALWAMAPSMLLHGSANMAVFVSCTMDGHVGWVHPTEMMSIVGLYGNYFCVVCIVAILAYREHKLLLCLEGHAQ